MVANDQNNRGLVGVAFEDGKVSLFEQQYSTDCSAGIEQRKIIPVRDYPYGTNPHVLMPDGGIKALDLSDSDTDLVLAVTGRRGRVRPATKGAPVWRTPCCWWKGALTLI